MQGRRTKAEGRRPEAAAAVVSPFSLHPSAAAQALQAKARSALKKQLAGAELSNAEISAVGKYEAQRERERRGEAYRRCAPGDLCALLAVGREQLRRWVGYGGPRNEDGSYNLATFLPWLLDQERARLKALAAPAQSALEQMRLEELDRKRRRGALERGELGPTDHFEAEFARLGGQLREALLGWANRLAPELAGLDAIGTRAKLAAEARKFLTRIARAAEKGEAHAVAPRVS